MSKSDENDQSLGFLFGALFTILVAMIVLINTDKVVFPVLIEYGERLCENNGGLHYVSFDIRDYTFHCNNNAVFFETISEQKNLVEKLK